MFKICFFASFAALGLATASQAAKAPQTGTPRSVQQLIACRALAEPAQRLACYDLQTETLSRDIANRNVVVIDHEKALAAKRGLFGFSVPDFGGLFGGDSDVKEISSTVSRAAKDPFGAWVISLADGSTWLQTDDQPLGLGPERGDKVVIHRGSLGAFFLRVNGQPGTKVKRVG